MDPFATTGPLGLRFGESHRDLVVTMDDWEGLGGGPGTDLLVVERGKLRVVRQSLAVRTPGEWIEGLFVSNSDHLTCLMLLESRDFAHAFLSLPNGDMNCLFHTVTTAACERTPRLP
jgi:hypothetical protein